MQDRQGKQTIGCFFFETLHPILTCQMKDHKVNSYEPLSGLNLNLHSFNHSVYHIVVVRFLG